MSPHFAFDVLPWHTIAEGARHKFIDRAGKRVRLLEVADTFVEHDWCTKGHVGYVLEGELEMTLESGTLRFGPGEGFVLRGSGVDKHKARAITPRALLFVVEDV